MGLESATYVSDLNTSNPASGDAQAQGDDHLRMLKAVLQATFPNADKAFRFPDAAAKTANYSVLSTDLNKIITVDATSGAATMTLPTLGASDDGWNCRFIKIDSSANAMILSGTINGAANLSIFTQYQFVEVHWSGTAWYATTGELDVAYLTALTAPAIGDLLAIYDLSATALRKITLENLFKVINGLTAETAPATADELALYDASAGTADKITLENMLKVVNSLTQITSGLDFTNDFLLLYDASAAAVRRVNPNDLLTQCVWFRDEQAANTAGQSLSDNTWNTVRLNTEHVDDIGVTLSSNSFVLPAGTYEIEAIVPMTWTGSGALASDISCYGKLRLQNTTAGTTLLYGQPSFGKDGNSQNIEQGAGSLSCIMRGRFTVAATQTLEVQMYVNFTSSVSSATQGWVVNQGTEIYADVIIKPVAH